MNVCVLGKGKCSLSRKRSFFVGEPIRLSILGHVNSLALSNYLGLIYPLSDLTLVEYVSSGEIEGSHLSKVYSFSDDNSASQNLIQKLFIEFIEMHPRLAGVFIDLLSKFNFRGKKFEIHVPISNLGKFPFLYENLVHRNQYLMRDLDKSTINVSLDLSNLPGYEQSSRNEFEYISKFTNALRDFLSSGIFPKLQTLNLDVYVSDGNSVSEWEGNVEILHNQKDNCSYTIVTKVIPAYDLRSMIQRFMETDIQALTHSPSDVSLATSILHPAKLVLVDKDSPLKLRTWTQIL